MNDLSKAKIGSKIAIPLDYSSGVNILSVTSVTEKQIVCGDTRVRKSDGLVLGTGGNAWHKRYAHIATEKDLLQKRITSVAFKLRVVSITEENLEAAEIFLEASKPKG